MYVLIIIAMNFATYIMQSYSVTHHMKILQNIAQEILIMKDFGIGAEK